MLAGTCKARPKQCDGSTAPVFSDAKWSVFTPLSHPTRPDFVVPLQRISYAKGRSHATIKQEAGDEVLYQVKMGIKDPDTLQDIVGGGKSKMVVSSAQASNVRRSLPRVAS